MGNRRAPTPYQIFMSRPGDAPDILYDTGITVVAESAADAAADYWDTHPEHTDKMLGVIGESIASYERLMKTFPPHRDATEPF